MSYMQNGILALSDIKENGQYPSRERLKKGPVAVAECIQQIPCNPCETACKFGAITVGLPITNCPEVDFDNCVGCGNCIAHCSGLAIFVLDMSYSDTKGSVSFPFEYQNIPKKGDQVRAVDRSGAVVCDGTVTRVVCPKPYDRTPVVTVEVPIEFVESVRGIEVTF